MKFQSLKRLIAEDFDQDYQALIQKIAFVYNPMVEQLNTLLNKNVDFNNLNQQLLTFTVAVDSLGIPIGGLQIVTSLLTAIQGIQCINAINTTDSTPLTGAPFVSFTRNNKTINITSITGLPANKKFNITVILYG